MRLDKKMEKGLKADYNFENDTLYLYTNEKYEKSIDFFGFIIDITKNKSVKGIEILEATKVFSNLTESKITKEMLNKISSAKMNTKVINELLFVEFDFKADNIDISLPLNIANPNLALT